MLVITINKSYLVQCLLASKGWYQILRVTVCSLIVFFKIATGFGSINLSSSFSPAAAAAESPFRVLLQLGMGVDVPVLYGLVWNRQLMGQQYISATNPV